MRLALDNTAFWIGATDNDSESNWIWQADGCPMHSFDQIWDSNQPDNGKQKLQKENCARINDGKMQDVSCELVHPFVCEVLSIVPNTNCYF